MTHMGGLSCICRQQVKVQVWEYFLEAGSGSTSSKTQVAHTRLHPSKI